MSLQLHPHWSGFGLAGAALMLVMAVVIGIRDGVPYWRAGGMGRIGVALWGIATPFMVVGGAGEMWPLFGVGCVIGGVGSAIILIFRRRPPSETERSEADALSAQPDPDKK